MPFTRPRRMAIEVRSIVRISRRVDVAPAYRTFAPSPNFLPIQLSSYSVTTGRIRASPRRESGVSAAPCGAGGRTRAATTSPSRSAVLIARATLGGAGCRRAVSQRYGENAKPRSSPARGGGRAGPEAGVSVRRPRWRRMRCTTGGSSIVATKRSRAPQTQARTSISKTRRMRSAHAQARREGALGGSDDAAMAGGDIDGAASRFTGNACATAPARWRDRAPRIPW